MEILTGYLLNRKVARPFMRGWGIAVECTSILVLSDVKGHRKLRESINEQYKAGKIGKELNEKLASCWLGWVARPPYPTASELRARGYRRERDWYGYWKYLPDRLSLMLVTRQKILSPEDYRPSDHTIGPTQPTAEESDGVLPFFMELVRKIVGDEVGIPIPEFVTIVVDAPEEDTGDIDANATTSDASMIRTTRSTVRKSLSLRVPCN